jgi:hypothetical protein
MGSRGNTSRNQEVIQMLFSRRNQGTKGLLQDATRASSRVAEQAQQTIAGIADESKGFAQTARSEIGDLSREVRDQAGGKVHRARRRTARKLSEAADAVEPTKSKGRGKGGTILKAALAAVAGWALVNVARKAKERDGATASEKAGDVADAAKSEVDDVKAGAKAAADKAKAEAEKVKAEVHADEQPAGRQTGNAKPAGTTATTRANASSK